MDFPFLQSQDAIGDGPQSRIMGGQKDSCIQLTGSLPQQAADALRAVGIQLGCWLIRQ
jgi:hypothetical protein